MTTIPKTRSHFESILEFPPPIPLRQLATNRNVINCYHYQRRIMPGNSTSSFTAQRVSDEVISLCEFSRIPTMSISTFSKKVQRLVNSYHKASK